MIISLLQAKDEAICALTNELEQLKFEGNKRKASLISSDLVDSNCEHDIQDSTDETSQINAIKMDGKIDENRGKFYFDDDSHAKDETSSTSTSNDMYINENYSTFYDVDGFSQEKQVCSNKYILYSYSKFLCYVFI